MTATLQIEMHISTDDELSPEEREELTYALRDEVLEAGAVDARPLAAGAAPAGTRAAEVLTAGALLMEIAPPLVEAMAATLQGWLARTGQRRIVLVKGDASLDITGLPPSDMKELADRFVTACLTED
jgi:hypothetical protein